VVLKLAPSTLTATPIPHILQLSTDFSIELTILIKTIRPTAAHTMALRYHQIERLCEHATAYYRPYTKRRRLFWFFRAATECVGMRRSCFWDYDDGVEYVGA
jgi:hypothetical protein